MPSALWIFGLLYSPIVLFVISIVAACRIDLKAQSVLTIQPLGIFGISFPINGALLVRFVMLSTAVGFLALYGIADYSTLFPQHLAMDVYFDEPGLKGMIDHVFTQRELAELGILRNWTVDRTSYFETIDREAAPILGKGGFFAVAKGSVHSSGRTSFRVRKIDGLQRYQIEESSGELVHTLDAPHIPQIQFRTFFEKLSTSYDYLDPSLWDLLLRGIIVRPRFKQSLAEDRTSRSVSFSVAIIGVTKGRLIPWPQFSSTIYCADIGDARLLPIAYAIYKGEGE